MSQVASFLGGIFFTSLLILIQLREAFSAILFIFEIFEHVKININEFYLIAIPLTLSVVTFIFSAIRFAGACLNENPEELASSAKSAYVIFRTGFVSMLFSLSAILLSTDISLGLLGILFIAIIVAYLWKR
jgi:hypothetical protein